MLAHNYIYFASINSAMNEFHGLHLHTFTYTLKGFIIKERIQYHLIFFTRGLQENVVLSLLLIIISLLMFFISNIPLLSFSDVSQVY